MLPMYYEYPEEEAAYQVPNEYIFGNQLLAAPVTTPRIPGINVSKTRVWLPKGMYFDIFTGARYQGGRMMDMYRTISSIPFWQRQGRFLRWQMKRQRRGKIRRCFLYTCIPERTEALFFMRMTMRRKHTGRAYVPKPHSLCPGHRPGSDH